MAQIIVSRGLCSPIRPDVLTALKPYAFKDLKIEAWGEGHWHMPIAPSQRIPDVDIWARKHVAVITVSDAAAAWAERLLWQSGKVWLESPPLNQRLRWTAPAACKAGEHGTLGRGTMPTPWSEKKGKKAKATKRNRLNVSGWLEPLRRR